MVLATAVLSSTSLAANLTWDASGTHSPSTDGSGTWSTTGAANWFDGTNDTSWIQNSTAIFGVGNGAAGTVTISDPSNNVNVAGITFNAPGSGNYIIAAAGANTLTLTNPVITVASGSAATISAPIAGTAGLTLSGGGTLTLSGINTFNGVT